MCVQFYCVEKISRKYKEKLVTMRSLAPFLDTNNKLYYFFIFHFFLTNILLIITEKK